MGAVSWVTCPACHEKVLVVEDWKGCGYEVCENCGVSFNPDTLEVVHYEDYEGAGTQGEDDAPVEK